MAAHPRRVPIQGPGGPWGRAGSARRSSVRAPASRRAYSGTSGFSFMEQAVLPLSTVSTSALGPPTPNKATSQKQVQSASTDVQALAPLARLLPKGNCEPSAPESAWAGWVRGEVAGHRSLVSAKEPATQQGLLGIRGAAPPGSRERPFHTPQVPTGISTVGSHFADLTLCKADVSCHL